jgi:hypothetical protein
MAITASSTPEPQKQVPFLCLPNEVSSIDINLIDYQVSGICSLMPALQLRTLPFLDDICDRITAQ